MDVTGQARVGAADDVLVAHDVAGGDGEGLAVGQDDRAVAERPQADLRSLQVGEQTDRAVRLGLRVAEVLEPLLVLRVGAVAHVEAGDVHARVDHLEEPVGVR
ncbi:hypothetical protein SDC9_191436 [bioreactor metagenome]|uniref:Uncharacterized protein n=1 Tax=bioreactor metagenome TaxID=1076179 RepID=A0A645HXV5_9ZZZZ